MSSNHSHSRLYSVHWTAGPSKQLKQKEWQKPTNAQTVIWEQNPAWIEKNPNTDSHQLYYKSEIKPNTLIEQFELINQLPISSVYGKEEKKVEENYVLWSRPILFYFYF